MSAKRKKSTRDSHRPTTKTAREETLFEIIGFEWNENNGVNLNPKDMVTGNCVGPNEVVRRFINEGKLWTDDAASFISYFGIPKDPDKASEWKKLNNVQRFDVALDLIIKSGFISFTKLL
jgi:hypothetical protein